MDPIGMALPGRSPRLAVVATAVAVLAACEADRTPPVDTGAPSASPVDTPTPTDAAATAGAPDADDFLPPLEGYRSDDVDAGEVRASLDHGAVLYDDVRRRVILDDDGFARGDITVVTFEPDTGGPDRFLEHWFGDAPRESIEIAGEALLRIQTQAHDAIAWTGPGFVVVFGRGQAVDHEWLEGLARATVEAR